MRTLLGAIIELGTAVVSAVFGSKKKQDDSKKRKEYLEQYIKRGKDGNYN